MAKTPKIRFKNFSDEWEVRNLGEIAKVIRGERITKNNLIENGDYPVMSGGTSYFGRYFKFNREANTITVAQYGSAGYIAFITERFWANDVCYSLFTLEAINNKFLYYALRNNQNLIYSLTTKATPDCLPKNKLESISISISSLQEQEKIGAFFSKLDKLIALHQSKFKKLQKIKKSCLQNLFPQNNQNTPKIRFKNFSDEWVENKLGEILIEQNNRTSNFNENPLYSLTIENGITKKTERYERDFLVKKTEDLFKIVQPNEFVTNPMNFRFGAFGYNNNKYKISVSGYYDVFSIDNNQCSHFWYAYFKTPLSLLKFNNVATGSLIEKRRVKFSTLQEIIFISPKNMAEKKQISDFFSKLDKLIALHQSKFKKLQKIKKSCLQNMFV